MDAETDTLIYPGENGILYLIRLNTKYDLNSGTLSIDPGRTVNGATMEQEAVQSLSGLEWKTVRQSIKAIYL
ncbi:MAG: hypothetical protein ACLUGJ_05435 [Blautia wexlerae]